MSCQTRRRFLKQTASGTAAFTLGSTALTGGRILGANERIGVALIGCGGRGRFVARGLVEAGADLVALCDLHEERLDQAELFLREAQPRKPIRCKEMARVFDRADVDAVIVATPDHWHAPASIRACQAGKDVYVEKPHAHNIWESRMLIKAARQYGRVLQAGTQNRSAPYCISAREYVSSGDLADDGIHQLDLALLLTGDPGLPGAVSCSGGRLVHRDDDGEVPDVQIASFEFQDFVMTMELTNYPRYMQKTTSTIRRNDLLPYWTQNATRIELYGSEMMMTVGRHGGGWQVTTSGGVVVEQMYGRPPDEPHYRNFIQCVKDRHQANADIGTAHQACVMVHAANIAHRVGNAKLRLDTEEEKFVDHAHANALLRRKYRESYGISSN